MRIAPPHVGHRRRSGRKTRSRSGVLDWRLAIAPLQLDCRPNRPSLPDSKLCRRSFFEYQAGSVEEGQDRADARLDAPLRREALLHLDKADVVLRLDQAEQDVAMGIELRASRLALRARLALSGLARPAHPDDGGGDPNPKADRSLPGRHAPPR